MSATLAGMRRFEGEIAVVTGGSSGLGLGIARRLAAEGATVVLWGRAPGRLAAAAAGAAGIEPARVDVTDERAVIRGVAAVLRKHGRLDVLVHSAGVVGPTHVDITRYPTRDFDRVCAVNLRGAFLVAKHAISPMARRGYGRMLLLASMAGKDGNPGMIGYTASKAGVFGLVKALGKEFATTGVTVNGLAPAVVRTPLVAAMAPEQVAYLTRLIPMGRTGTIEEVAALAAWIVSRECSFTTGFVFDLSGGRATY